MGEMDRRQSKYICNECDVIFEIYNFFEQRRKYCPKCGDYLAVKTYKPKIIKGRWNDEEIEILDQLINGKITFYAAKLILNRTDRAIETRKSIRSKELEKPRRLYVPWDDDEKEMVDKYISGDGDVSLEEVAKKTGRNLQAVELFYYRRKRKLKKQGVIL